MSEPRNAVLKQFTVELEAYGAKLEVSECAQRAIAREARRAGTGARGLRSLLEKMLLEARYQAPEHTSSNILLSGEGTNMPLIYIEVHFHTVRRSVLNQGLLLNLPRAIV
jgi:ATP-dependent protease Clp ATPase subunit